MAPASVDLPNDFPYPSMQHLGEDLVTVLDQLRIKYCIGLGDGAGSNIIGKTFLKKNTFLHSILPYHVKKHYSTLEMDTFKIMLLLSYLASLDNKPRT